jgi:hypothetical protein
MNIKLDIEVTPQELRSFFGLPDVEPLQQEMLEIIRRNMGSGADGFDPLVLMKPWLPPHLQTMEGLYGLWQGFQKTKASPE